jgi:hypothetical protein
VHIGRDESDIGANCAYICEMIVDALEFEARRAQGASARRCFDIRSPLDCMTKGDGVSEARIAGNALRKT